MASRRSGINQAPSTSGIHLPGRFLFERTKTRQMSVYRLTPSERETVITINDADQTARVFTWQRRYQQQMLKNPEARLVEEGIHKHTADKFMECEGPRHLVKSPTGHGRA